MLFIVILVLGIVIFFNAFNMPAGSFLAVVLFSYFSKKAWDNEVPKENLNYGVFCSNMVIFSTLGATLSFSKIYKSDIAYSFCILFVGLCVRLLSTMLILLVKKDLNLKEKLYIGIIYLSKGTVQAVYSSTIRLQAIENANTEYQRYGEQIQTLCVICILLTIPLSAILGRVLGPIMLAKETAIHTFSPQNSVNHLLTFTSIENNSNGMKSLDLLAQSRRISEFLIPIPENRLNEEKLKCSSSPSFVPKVGENDLMNSKNIELEKLKEKEHEHEQVPKKSADKEVIIENNVTNGFSPVSTEKEIRQEKPKDNASDNSN